MKLLGRFLLIALIPIMIFFTVFVVTYYTLFQESLINSEISEASSLLQLTSTQLSNPVYFFDVEKIDQISDRLEDHDNILSTFVFSSEGEMISDFESNVFPHTNFLEQAISSNDLIYEIQSNQMVISSPILVDRQIGVLIVEYSLDSVNQLLFHSLLLVIGISLISSGIVGLVSFGYSRKITNDLAKISKYSTDILSNKKHEKIPPSSIDEINELQKSLETMQQNLESYKHELIKSERLSTIGELAARLSHDLRNPLGMIRNSLDLIDIKNEIDQIPPETASRLKIIRRQTERLHHQINNVLDFVRSKELSPSTISFQKFLEDSFESVAISDEIVISKPKNDLELTIDVEQMKVVFVNIITNAIQAIGNNPGKIYIKIFDKQDDIHIEIGDSGPGIDPRNYDRIFDPLYTTKQEGTGLGLASCYTIVKQHGGKINIEKGEFGGALFTIIVPKKIPL